MAIRKPNGGAKAVSTAPLTSVQDTRSRGNGNGNGERVLMSFKIPSDLKMMLQRTRADMDGRGRAFRKNKGMVWLRQKHASRKGRQRANRKRRPKRIGLRQNRPQRDRSSRYAR